MTLETFRRLSQLDFTNGAVTTEIENTLARREFLEIELANEVRANGALQTTILERDARIRELERALRWKAPIKNGRVKDLENALQALYDSTDPSGAPDDEAWERATKVMGWR